ncbi:hypothetical protein V2J09_015736 [Rumex salicifolius]
MDFPCCPICDFPVPASDLERHANEHFEEDQLFRDLELAKQLAFAPSSPPNSVDVPSSSTSIFRGNNDPTETQCIDGQVCSALRLQYRSPFHKIGGGLLALLKNCLESEANYSRSILSGYIDHFESTESEDKGWGCGWRNIQMATSHLLMHRPEAKEVLFGGCGFVPDISSLQRWLEVAWKKGFDVVGSSHFAGRVCGTKMWIGTTECAALFRSFGLRARVVDFDGKIIASSIGKEYGPMDKYVSRNRLTNRHKSDDRLVKKNKIYQALVDWVWNYFSDHSSAHSVKQCVSVTNKMPLYFQHNGHSRTIVGIQLKQQKNGMKHYNLLILDPGHRTIELEESLKANSGWQKLLKRGIHTLKKPQYQLCYVDNGIAHGKELEQLKTIDSVEKPAVEPVICEAWMAFSLRSSDISASLANLPGQTSPSLALMSLNAGTSPLLMKHPSRSCIEFEPGSELAFLSSRSKQKGESFSHIRNECAFATRTPVRVSHGRNARANASRVKSMRSYQSQIKVVIRQNFMTNHLPV